MSFDSRWIIVGVVFIGVVGVFWYHVRYETPWEVENYAATMQFMATTMKIIPTGDALLSKNMTQMAEYADPLAKRYVNNQAYLDQLGSAAIPFRSIEVEAPSDKMRGYLNAQFNECFIANVAYVATHGEYERGAFARIYRYAIAFRNKNPFQPTAQYKIMGPGLVAWQAKDHSIPCGFIENLVNWVMDGFAKLPF